MLSGITGNIFASGGRDLNPTIQPTQHEDSQKTNASANHAIQQAKSDTVSISSQALAMAKDAQKKSGDGTEKH